MSDGTSIIDPGVDVVVLLETRRMGELGNSAGSQLSRNCLFFLSLFCMLRIFLACFAFTFRLISLFSILLLHTVKKMQGNYVIVVVVVVVLFAAKNEDDECVGGDGGF